MSYIAPFVFSAAAAFISVKFIIRFFPRWNFLDRPAEYGLKRCAVPYSAGIVFFVVFLLSTVIFVDISKQILGVIFAALMIVVVSFADDRARLPPLLRLIVQALAGAVVVMAGVKIQLIQNPFGAPVFLDSVSFNIFGEKIWLYSALFIIVWLILMMNVMNWLDGIPGLASGVSTIAQTAIFLLAIRQTNIVDQSALIAISGVLAVSTLVFLFFDFPAPKILMGDTGSMFLGFMLGILSILAGGKLATALLIMGFPVLDAFWVILRRILKGQSPFKGDYSHFHHRLLNVGFSEKKALLFNYFFCGLFTAIALLLDSAYKKFLAFLAVFAVMTLLGVVLFIRERRNK